MRRLDGGLDAGAINVSAGAGYGKTTLLASWAAELEPTVGVAWLTIRPWHNDPTVFAEDLGGQLSGAGLLPTANTAWPVLSDLVAGLHDREPTRGVVILDDVHVLRDSSIYQALSELLQDTPRGLCLVVSGREDAPLPWGTRRTRRGLVEIRERDLVFDDDETGRLLAHSLGVSPTDPRLRSAIEEAEGWAAGLVLTALALTPSDGSPDVALSPRHDQNVAEFVGEAILASCTADVRGFLEATCVLPVLEPDLCDELTGRTDSLAVLRDLARRNCLTVELAADRPSFRYHPLLRRVLRRRLDEQDAVRRVTLTRDAALRLAKRDRIIEATNLLAASEDAELLEGFVRRACGPAMVRGYVITVLSWISALPPQRVEAAPDLLLLLARASGLRGERLKAEAAVRQARRRVDRADTTPDPGLGTALLFFEMSVKAWHGEIADVIPLLHQLASPGAHPAESPTLSMLGLSREAMLPNLSMGLLLQGHLDDCLGVTDEVITLADLTPLTRSAVLGIGVRALALAWSGRDSEAAHLVRHAVTPIAAWRGSDPDPLAFWCAAAWIGPSADANASLARARDLASRTIIPILSVLPEVVAIRVHIRLGQFDLIEDALRNASAAIAELPEQGFLTNLLRRLELDARRTVGTRPDLTTQEIRTLHAVATGMTRREVADHLHYSVNTVKTHLRSAYLKLGVADRHDAITRARAWGMLPPTAGAGSDTA